MFFNGTSCLDCPVDCNACSSPNGTCTECNSPYEITTDGTCGCKYGYYDSGTECVEATVVCTDGNYNDGTDNCVACGTGCASCENYDGACTTCEGSMQVSTNDNTQCGDSVTCVKRFGESKEYGCVSSPYSSVRLIPPYTSSSTSVDWRNWGVVHDMTDQGVCGSCYSFSTIAAAESAYAIMTGTLYKLSE